MRLLQMIDLLLKPRLVLKAVFALEGMMPEIAQECGRDHGEDQSAGLAALVLAGPHGQAATRYQGQARIMGTHA